jgi:hypothetical protein
MRSDVDPAIVFVHSIVIIEISSQSAVSTATGIIAIVRGIAARTTFEVVSSRFFLRSGAGLYSERLALGLSSEN